MVCSSCSPTCLGCVPIALSSYHIYFPAILTSSLRQSASSGINRVQKYITTLRRPHAFVGSKVSVKVIKLLALVVEKEITRRFAEIIFEACDDVILLDLALRMCEAEYVN